MALAVTWWIILFGVTPAGAVEQVAFLRTPPDVETYEACQAVIPTLSVALSERGGLASCFQAPEGVDIGTIAGRVIPIPAAPAP